MYVGTYTYTETHFYIETYRNIHQSRNMSIFVFICIHLFISISICTHTVSCKHIDYTYICIQYMFSSITDLICLALPLNFVTITAHHFNVSHRGHFHIFFGDRC